VWFLGGSSEKPETERKINIKTNESNILHFIPFANNDRGIPNSRKSQTKEKMVVSTQTSRYQKTAKSIDYNRLYYAVAIAESGNCRTAWHSKANNCVSIMSWTGGHRHLKKFKSIRESKTAFINLWKKVYRKFPDLELAKKYTGNDRPRTWLQTVKNNY